MSSLTFNTLSPLKNEDMSRFVNQISFLYKTSNLLLQPEDAYRLASWVFSSALDLSSFLLVITAQQGAKGKTEIARVSKISGFAHMQFANTE